MLLLRKGFPKLHLRLPNGWEERVDRQHYGRPRSTRAGRTITGYGGAPTAPNVWRRAGEPEPVGRLAPPKYQIAWS